MEKITTIDDKLFRNRIRQAEAEWGYYEQRKTRTG
jgi:stalled ribosome alternative rescue factor ArfA